MTRRNARSLQILSGLAIATLLLAGCARRTPPVAINTPEPILRPTASGAAKATAARPTAISTPRTTTLRPTSTATSSFVPTVIASVEKTVTVGSEMVACSGEGAGSGRCYQVKEEGANEWTVFPGRIEGFEYWPGAEYVMIIREDKIANPPPGGSDVMWTIVKGLYKSNVPQTPTAAP
jgi:hypothetical protein